MEILAELDDAIVILATVLFAFGLLFAYWALTVLLSTISRFFVQSLARIKVSIKANSVEQRPR